MEEIRLIPTNRLVDNPVYIRFEGLYTRRIAKPITDVIYNYFGVQECDIATKYRGPDMVRVRHLVYYFLLRRTKLGLRQMGLIMGGQDHATVLNGIRVITNAITPIGINGGVTIPDKELKRLVDELETLMP